MTKERYVEDCVCVCVCVCGGREKPGQVFAVLEGVDGELNDLQNHADPAFMFVFFSACVSQTLLT